MGLIVLARSREAFIILRGVQGLGGTRLMLKEPQFQHIPVEENEETGTHLCTLAPAILQEHVLDLVREGRNVFFTGNAGTGKTFLLSRILTEVGVLNKQQAAVCPSPPCRAAAEVWGRLQQARGHLRPHRHCSHTHPRCAEYPSLA
eukprot:scaffold125837_cov22-Tisochrysis_lutea.AAC.1